MKYLLYEKFTRLFPLFASGEYSYMRLESEGFEPLSLEWIASDRISVMHTYELNGDLCYDPMMEFRFNNISKTMSACMFEQSIPPVYQFFDNKGIGKGADGNGNNYIISTLQSKLDTFASQWLDNIAEQGYIPVKAITFDEDRNPITSETNKELDLPHGDEDRFEIYQISDKARKFLFVPMRELEALGLPVSRDNYELVYTAPLEFLSDRYQVLNKIYEDFNLHHPADYKGRSVSVSDVIVLKYNGNVSSHYVDRVGFVELNAFLDEEK